MEKNDKSSAEQWLPEWRMECAGDWSLSGHSSALLWFEGPPIGKRWIFVAPRHHVAVSVSERCAQCR